MVLGGKPEDGDSKKEFPSVPPSLQAQLPKLMKALLVPPLQQVPKVPASGTGPLTLDITEAEFEEQVKPLLEVMVGCVPGVAEDMKLLTYDVFTKGYEPEKKD